MKKFATNFLLKYTYSRYIIGMLLCICFILPVGGAVFVDGGFVMVVLQYVNLFLITVSLLLYFLYSNIVVDIPISAANEINKILRSEPNNRISYTYSYINDNILKMEFTVHMSNFENNDYESVNKFIHSTYISNINNLLYNIGITFVYSIEYD